MPAENALREILYTLLFSTWHFLQICNLMMYFTVFLIPFPFIHFDPCKTNGRFLQWTPIRISSRLSLFLSSPSFARAFLVCTRTGSRRTTGREATVRKLKERELVGRSLHCCSPLSLSILRLRGNVADNGFGFGRRRFSCETRCHKKRQADDDDRRRRSD